MGLRPMRGHRTNTRDLRSIAHQALSITVNCYMECCDIVRHAKGVLLLEKVGTRYCYLNGGSSKNNWLHLLYTIFFFNFSFILWTIRDLLSYSRIAFSGKPPMLLTRLHSLNFFQQGLTLYAPLLWFLYHIILLMGIEHLYDA